MTYTEKFIRFTRWDNPTSARNRYDKNVKIFI